MFVRKRIDAHKEMDTRDRPYPILTWWSRDSIRESSLVRGSQPNGRSRRSIDCAAKVDSSIYDVEECFPLSARKCRHRNSHLRIIRRVHFILVHAATNKINKEEFEGNIYSVT